MNELLRLWAELEPGALTYSPGSGQFRLLGARAGEEVLDPPVLPDESQGQNVLLHALWAVIEVRAWRWVILFSPEAGGGPPYLARVSVSPSGEGQTRRGVTPAQALLASYVAVLERQRDR